MSLPHVNSLFNTESDNPNSEQLSSLLKAPGLRLEKIVSFGHATAKGEWYDQHETEWVMLAQGSAQLCFDPGGLIDLQAGDFLTIPVHLKHRVEACSDDAVWLALHFASPIRIIK
jgi:cupin 2 domain-containing protein